MDAGGRATHGAVAERAQRIPKDAKLLIDIYEFSLRSLHSLRPAFIVSGQILSYDKIACAAVKLYDEKLRGYKRYRLFVPVSQTLCTYAIVHPHLQPVISSGNPDTLIDIHPLILVKAGRVYYLCNNRFVIQQNLYADG